MLREYSSETAQLHNIIIGILIGIICILTVALLILIIPILRNFLKRKIPVSQQRVDRRYDTIERWLISKVCAFRICFTNTPYKYLSHF